MSFSDEFSLVVRTQLPLSTPKEVQLQKLITITSSSISIHLNLHFFCRQFLWSFRLPGEAQKIDRMMECFAKRYCDCQGENNIFENSDTCYVLSFAIIMLNTSLHNPSVKEKPSIEQFINMNRGINMGQDLPRELLVVSLPFFPLDLFTKSNLHH